MTPADAIRAGASHLVVARPIVKARRPPCGGGSDPGGDGSGLKDNPGEENMPKGYWIAHVEVRDPEAYKDYVAAAKLAFDKYGARFLARGGPFVATEGKGRARNVVIEFPSLQAAQGLLLFAGIHRGQGDPPEVRRCGNGARRGHFRRKSLKSIEVPESLDQRRGTALGA